MLYTYQNISGELKERFKTHCSVKPHSNTSSWQRGYEVIIGKYRLDADFIEWKQYNEIRDYIFDEIQKQLPEILL